MSVPTYATVETEDCNLHYWYQGTGPLLIFLPGGNGHGRQYNAIMAVLSPHYTVATFDRRQMSASTVSGRNKFWNPAQQARDIIAVMRAIGHSTTSLFCSSGGGINGLQLAVSYPEVIETLVLHEAPTTSLLSAKESTELMDCFFAFQDIYVESGLKPAMAAFHKQIMVGMEDGIPRLQNEPHNQINQFECESPWMGLYCPDLDKVKENGTKVVVAYGEKSLDAIYVRTGIVQAERLGCERVMFPGHHQGFETESEAFGLVLKEVLEKAGKKSVE